MNSDIEEIKNRLNIVDILGEYIRLEKTGNNWRALCPFHNEKSPSFMVAEDKQIWHCFGCQKGGDMFAFVMEMEGLDFRETLKILAEKAGVELKRADPKKAKENNRNFEILELATKFYQAHLLQTASGKKILQYLKERGLNDQSIKNFRLGYAPKGWDNIARFLSEKGYKVQEIARAGLLVEKNNQGNASRSHYDRFRDRIMFPIADTNGKIVGYSARVSPGSDESQAKYINTPETEIYHKSKILYGINLAKAEIKKKDEIFLVEGQMDVIASHQAGIGNTVAVSGTALTQDHLDIIRRYTRNIKMCFDMDQAGELATKKSLKLCFEREANVSVVSIPSGKDAAELARENPGALREAIKGGQGAMDYIFNKVFSKYDRNKIEDKKRISQELLEMVSHLGNNLEKNHWLKKISQELGIDESVLTDMLKKDSLRSRVEKRSSQEKGDAHDYFSSGDKIAVLVKDLIGLMLVYSGVWKEILKQKDRIYLPHNELLEILLEKGEEFGFSFDALINGIDSAEIRSRLERIYFEGRYRIGLDNKFEEIQLDDPQKEAENRLAKIKYESNKNNLDKISRDLDIAKKNHDKEAVRFLSEEYRKINAEQAVLNKKLA